MSVLVADTRIPPRPDTFDMVVVHRVFKRELALLPRFVRAVARGDRSRAAELAAHYRLVADLLDHHHTGEDELIWPTLLERAAPQADVVRRMEEQHAELHELLERVGHSLSRWEIDADQTHGEALAAALDDLYAVAAEHLLDEEREMLPLIEENLSVSEWNALGESGQRGFSKRRLLLILGLMLEEATAEEEAKCLAMLPPHARIVWRAYGAASYRRYVRRVRAS